MIDEQDYQKEKIKILVVDDAKIILNFYEKGLSRLGYDVDSVESAIEAQKMITNKQYDIVISDIYMELMDGMELLDVIKRDYPHIEVIMMTGYASVENAIEALKKGAYDFLLKPVKLEQVKMVVGNCVEKIQMNHEVQQLKEVNKRLKEIKEMKDRFIAITSHELRTPVSHIKSYLDFMEEPEFPEKEKKEFMNIIKGSLSDLERIVNNMYEVSKIDQNQLSLNQAPTQINKIVDECLKQLSANLMNRDLNIHHNNDVALPMAFVDPFQIKKVILELLNNAIRFTPDSGTIEINYDSQDKFLSLEIKDTGIGIPEEKLGTIFEKFYEIQDSKYHTSSKYDFMGGSTGIGLYLAKGIVEAHNGRLKIESEEDVGTTVTIYLKK